MKHKNIETLISKKHIWLPALFFLSISQWFFPLPACCDMDPLFRSWDETVSLVKKLDSFDPNERRKAAIGLKEISEKHSEPEQFRFIEKTEPQRIITRSKEMAMAVEGLIVSNGDFNSRVRQESVAAIGEYGKEAALLLSSSFFYSDKNRKTALTLENLKDKISRELKKAALDRDSRVACQSDKEILKIRQAQVKQKGPVKLAVAENNNSDFESGPFFGGESEDPFDNSDDFFLSEENSKPYSISGYAESENYMGFYNNFPDSHLYHKTSPRKAEAHVKLDINCGTESAFLKATVHGYAYVPGSETTDQWYENRVEVPEFYLSYLKPWFDIQAGKQIIKWGTADTINPTSYFNPYDLTENLLKEDDELVRGVYALSGKVLFNDYSLQAVISPVHTPPELPDNVSPWQMVFPWANMNNTALPVLCAEPPDELDTSLKNTACGLRLTGIKNGVDFSLSYFRGPDRDVTLKPELVIDPADPLTPYVAMIPQYGIISAVGGDIAFTVSNISFQAEAAWTKDKPAATDITKTGEPFSKMEETGFLFWAAGGTWLTDNDCTIILEYLDGFYTKNPDRYLDPMFSSLLSGSLTKNILDDRLTIELKGLFNTSGKDSLFIPSLEWNFQNDLHLKLSCSIFSGHSDTFFGSYNYRDIASLRLRYYF